MVCKEICQKFATILSISICERKRREFMFILETEEVPSMGLTKHIVDYILTPREGIRYSSKAERFKHNTSGRSSGGRDIVMTAIKATLNKHPELAMTPEDVYHKILEKLEDSGLEFNVNKMRITDIDKYALKIVNYTFRSIFQEIKKKNKKGEKEIELVTAEDRSGDETKKVTLEDEMFRLGMLDSGFEDERSFTEQDARVLLVQSLDHLKMFSDTIFSQRDKEVNALKPLQHVYAYERFHEEQERLERKNKDAMKDPRVSRVSNKKDMGASIGLDYNTYFKQTLRMVLVEDYQTKERRLFRIYKDIMTALNRLNIDVVWIDADEVMTDEYIRKLKQALDRDRTICISEYDIEELDLNITAVDVKTDFVRDTLVKSGVPQDKIPQCINRDVLDRIYQVKASEFRKLNMIISDIQHGYNVYTDSNKFATMNKGDKNVKDIQRNTPEYLDRERYVNTTLLRGFSTKKKDEEIFVPGPFSDECLEIIKKVTTEFFDDLWLNDPMRALSLQQQGIDIIERTPKLKTDGNDFVQYDNGWYFFMQTDKPFHEVKNENNRLRMNKWLVNTKGFFVNKFVDALVREGEELEPHSACKRGKFDMLIIKTFDGEVIPTGLDG